MLVASSDSLRSESDDVISLDIEKKSGQHHISTISILLTYN